MKTTIPFCIVLAFLSVTVSPKARATCQQGCLTNDNTTGYNNTENGFDALDSNTPGPDNALASGNWTPTSSLNTARFLHTATLLQNGKVLVAGGSGFSGISASAELYDPASGTWTATGSLNTARRSHTATLLQNGMVLVAGGLDSNRTVSASAELGQGHR